MAGGIQIKLVLSIVFATVTATAGSIIASKDSLWINNNPVSSRWTDLITLKNNGSMGVVLDSIRLSVSGWDASSFKPSAAGAEVRMEELHHGNRKMRNGTFDSLGATEFRLDFSPGMPSGDSLFAIGPSGDSTTLQNLQIGFCFSCGLEKYPRYLTGTLRFYFSNGQAVGIRIYTDDLRPTGIHTTLPVRPVVTTRSTKTAYLLNGRPVSGKAALYLRGHRVHRLIGGM